NKAKQKVGNKANEQVDKSIDKTIDPSSGKPEKDPGEPNAAPGPAKPATDTAKNESGATPSIKAYSKYDFVPGEKIVVFEDFAQDAVGDFPDKWNTNASAEVVTIETLQGKWLKISKQ